MATKGMREIQIQMIRWYSEKILLRTYAHICTRENFPVNICMYLYLYVHHKYASTQKKTIIFAKKISFRVTFFLSLRLSWWINIENDMVKRISFSLLFLSFLCCSYAQEVRDAQFPGGDKALQQFIRTHAIYDFIRFFLYIKIIFVRLFP